MRKCALQLLSKLMCFNPFGKFLPVDQLAASLDKYKLELQVWFALHGPSHLSVSTYRLHDECNMAEFGCCGQQKQQLQVTLACKCASAPSCPANAITEKQTLQVNKTAVKKLGIL